MTLFETGTFTLHSGAETFWRINCDRLTDADLETLAAVALHGIPTPRTIEGVATGGHRFSDAIGRACNNDPDGPLLIVDDVLTTGASMEEQRAGRHAIGVVIFARGPCPPWVTPLFTTAHLLRADVVRELITDVGRIHDSIETNQGRLKSVYNRLLALLPKEAE